MEKTVELKSSSGLLVQDLGALAPAEEGCVLELSVLLEAVAPECRTAVAVTLTELDERDREYPRGTRVLLVPAHHGEAAADVPLRNLRFLLPPELNVSGGRTRRFQVRVERQCIDCPAFCVLTQAEKAAP